MDPISLVSVEFIAEQLDLRAPVRASQKLRICLCDSDAVVLQPRVEIAYLLVTGAKQQFQPPVRELHTTKQPVVQPDLARESTRGVGHRRPERSQMREIGGGNLIGLRIRYIAIKPRFGEESQVEPPACIAHAAVLTHELSQMPTGERNP